MTFWKKLKLTIKSPLWPVDQGHILSCASQQYRELSVRLRIGPDTLFQVEIGGTE